MSELFSTVRLIDYFLTFEMRGIVYDSSFNLENMDLIFNSEDYNPVKVRYHYEVTNRIPKNEYKNIYEFDIKSVFQMLPSEFIYLNRPPANFFSLIFTSSKFFFKNSRFE
jgi:hypothetical protein